VEKSDIVSKAQIQHIKKMVELTTTAITELVNQPASLMDEIDHPQEFLDRPNPRALKEVQCQECLMKLLELNMQMRTELIYMGASFAKEVQTEVYPFQNRS